MKAMTVLTMMTLMLTAAVRAQDDAEVAAVLQRLHEGCEAYRTGDAEYLEGFLDVGYTLTSTRGVVTNREQDLAEVRSGDPRYEEFRNHDMKVRIYGDTAVVNGITSLKGISGGQAFELDAQFTDTLVKRDGKWMLVASHATRLEK